MNKERLITTTTACAALTLALTWAGCGDKAYEEAKAALEAAAPEEWAAYQKTPAYESPLSEHSAAMKAARMELKRARLAVEKAAPEELRAWEKAQSKSAVSAAAGDRIHKDEIEAATDKLVAAAPDEYDAYVKALIDEAAVRERAQRTVTASEHLAGAAPEEWAAYRTAMADLKTEAPEEFRAYVEAHLKAEGINE